MDLHHNSPQTDLTFAFKGNWYIKKSNENRVRSFASNDRCCFSCCFEDVQQMNEKFQACLKPSQHKLCS